MLLDFSTPHTMYFADNCTDILTSESCFANNTIVSYFPFNGTSPKAKWLRPFENMVWGGFNVSGSVYLTYVCLDVEDLNSFGFSQFCHSNEVYAAEVINKNEFTIQGPAGFIGMGFESIYWPAYVDYSSSQASYTIASL